MEVTEISLTITNLSENKVGVLAYVNLVLDGVLAIKGVRLVRTPTRKVISMPYREKQGLCISCGNKNSLNHTYCFNCGVLLKFVVPKGERIFIDVVHPTNPILRRHLEGVIFEEFEKELKDVQKNKS